MRIIILIVLTSLFASCSTSKKWIKTVTKIEDGLHDIEIVNKNVAFAYSYGTGKFFKTTDGGVSWENIYQFDSLYFEQIQFIDERTGWLAGSPNKLFKTENGGENWLNVSLKTEPENSLIYGMYFQDINNGYVAIINRNKTGVTSNIYFTKNGGEEWQLINSIDEMILNLEKIDNTIHLLDVRRV